MLMKEFVFKIVLEQMFKALTLVHPKSRFDLGRLTQANDNTV